MLYRMLPNMLVRARPQVMGVFCSAYPNVQNLFAELQITDRLQASHHTLVCSLYAGQENSLAFMVIYER